VAKRSFPKPRGIKRRVGVRPPKKLIFVVCEGRNTEPNYLNDFSKDRGNNLFELVIEDKHGAPITLVDHAIHVKKEQSRLARTSGDSFEQEFEVWIVTDVDEHPSLSQARDKARNNGIECAISNPCFELWAILHFEPHDAPSHRHELQKKLEKLMPHYKTSGGKNFNYEQMKDKYEEAKKNAQRINSNRIAEANKGGCPSTNVAALLDSLIG